eukprot:gene2661-3857_t
MSSSDDDSCGQAESNTNFYKMIRPLNSGTTSRVMLAVDIRNEQKVAIRVQPVPVEIDSDNEEFKIDPKAIKMQEQIQNEILIYQRFKKYPHKNIIPLIDILEDATNNEIWMVLEYCDGGDLMDKIEKEDKLTKEKSKKYFLQLLEGIEFIHSLGVCHRDLKPENLLFSGNELKIGDFGWASEIEYGTLFDEIAGTDNYAAPEVLSGDSYCGIKADIWSLGVILYCMLTGCFAFDDKDRGKLITKMKNEEMKFPLWIDDDGKDLILRILKANPKLRPTIEEIKKHQFFK